MAPTPKRKTAKKPPPKLRGNLQPLAISLPPELVAEIDALAAKESRSRAKMIEVGMREFLQTYRQRSAA